MLVERGGPGQPDVQEPLHGVHSGCCCCFSNTLLCCRGAHQLSRSTPDPEEVMGCQAHGAVRAQQSVRPQVGEATCLDSLSYHEAWELSYFGASVLHPRTTMPARKFGIPIVIRNFFNQSAPGARLRSCICGCFRCCWSCAAGPGAVELRPRVIRSRTRRLLPGSFNVLGMFLRVVFGTPLCPVKAMAPLAGPPFTAVLGPAGTVISDDSVMQADAASSGKGLVKGFATIDHVALINVEGTGMVRPMQPHLQLHGM